MRAEMVSTGELPLEYMIRVMRDETAEPARRDAMAVAAAPYLHARLAAIAHQHINEDGTPVRPVLNLYFKEIPGADRLKRLSQTGNGSKIAASELLPIQCEETCQSKTQINLYSSPAPA
jgi:hypothetical protein